MDYAQRTAPLPERLHAVGEGLTQICSLTLHPPVYTYKTIAKPSAGAYREKGSRFLAFGFPVNTEVEIKSRLEELRKEYFDARQYCYAWILGPDKSRFRTFDDGEPNHSAGDPILGQIRSHDLTNMLIVVVRYCGGVKLGIGGLINAYRSAAAEALDNATIINCEVEEELTLEYDYSVTADLMRLIKEFDLRMVTQSYQERGALTVRVPSRNKDRLQERLKLMAALGKNVRVAGW